MPYLVWRPLARFFQFVLLFCKLFLIVLFLRPAFETLGTLCNKPQQKKPAKPIILCPCNILWKLFLSFASLQLSSHGTISFNETSVFDCCYTTSGRRFVSTMLEKNNFLSRSILSCPLSSNNVLLAVLVSTVDSSCLTNCMSSLRVGWSFCFFLTSANSQRTLSCRHL